MRDVTKSRQQLQGFLLRNGRIHAGKKGWTVAYRRWLTTIRFDHPAQQIVLQDYIHVVQDAEARAARILDHIEALLPTWCGSAWKKDPLGGVIGVQKGPLC